MKIMKLSSYVVAALLSTPAVALNLYPVADEASDFKISSVLSNSNAQVSNTFLSNEPIQLSFTFNPPKSVQNAAEAKLYLVAQFNDALFMRTPLGWVAWDGQLDNLVAFDAHRAPAQEDSVTVFKQELLPAGEYAFYAGLQLNNTLYFNQTPVALAVFDKNATALHRVRNKMILSRLFASGNASVNRPVNDSFAPATSVSTGASPTPSSSTSTAVSQTNLQEVGVDESDRIKTLGSTLFALENCTQDKTRQCLTAYQLLEKPAAATQLGQLPLEAQNYDNGALYVSPSSTASAVSQLVYINNSFNYSIYDTWFNGWYWNDNQTTLQWIDITNPAAMQSTRKLTLNAALIASRVVGDTLYVVTRKNPHYASAPTYPVALGASAGAELNAVGSDVLLLPESKPKPLPPKIIDSLLPTLAFNQDAAKPLVAAADCYIPPHSSTKVFDNTLITITAIPLHNPTAYYSVCIAGNVETVYMSTQSIYLATQYYPTQMAGNTVIYDVKQWPEVSTQIHKFALGTDALTYRGSGSVPGHLGWYGDKMSFRMGEYNNILKVATSLGQTWNDTSRTRVAVLQEGGQQQLQEIAFLDNLGKKGEELYAARFLQNRGYLVTFRSSDPLYVLDFNEPSKPRVLGELQVSGYSDYLHPIGENFLLGMGKHAIPAAQGGGDNQGVWFNRGAWYQGLKLSLFDVTDGTRLKELDSVIIGKRGTDSSALYDHHAFAWLAQGTQATLALPVALHNNQFPSNYGYNGGDYTQPNAYFDWTHTGLYSFTINTGAKPGISLNRRLIANVNNLDNYGSYIGESTWNDRAVIFGHSVHYVHDNRVLSSELAP